LDIPGFGEAIADRMLIKQCADIPAHRPSNARRCNGRSASSGFFK
jgi:hypothetical protein